MFVSVLAAVNRAGKSHLYCAVLYCHLVPVRLYNMFPNDLIKGTIFGAKKVTEHKMCFQLGHLRCAYNNMKDKK
jgi:hypothetical protein